MTTWLSPQDVAVRVQAAVPDSVVEATDVALVLDPARLTDCILFLRDDDALDLSFLSNLTAVDRDGELEMVYHLQSLDQNHILTVKVAAGGYDDPRVASLEPLYHGALLQECEVYDLFGITFEGHPDLKRIFLWDGFPGHPLRKSFLQMPGNLTAGLPGFSHESGDNDWPVPGSVEERPVHPNQAARTNTVPVPGDPPVVQGGDA
jgi:NADH-quinone oxidoreductase subunit C